MALVKRRKAIPAKLSYVEDPNENLKVLTRSVQRNIDSLCSCGRRLVYLNLPSHCPYCGRRNYYAVSSRPKYERAVVEGEKVILETRCFACKVCGNDFFDDTTCVAPALKAKGPTQLELEAAKRSMNHDDFFTPFDPEMAPPDAHIETIGGRQIAITQEQKDRMKDILSPLLRKYQGSVAKDEVNSSEVTNDNESAEGSK